jgi:hypothetical protein
MIAAERNALEKFYKQRQNQLQRPDYGGFKDQITELLRCSIYPTTRAPDYIVDQLGYGEIVVERRGDAVASRSERHRVSFQDRRVRRTRSGMIVTREDGAVSDVPRQEGKARNPRSRE